MAWTMDFIDPSTGAHYPDSYWITELVVLRPESNLAEIHTAYWYDVANYEAGSKTVPGSQPAFNVPMWAGARFFPTDKLYNPLANAQAYCLAQPFFATATPVPDTKGVVSDALRVKSKEAMTK